MIDAMIDEIVATYERATPGQKAAGTSWYPDARSIVDVISAASGIDSHRVTHALAALSPRNPWAWNVADAYAFAMAAACGDPGPPLATTYSKNRVNAWDALTGDGAPWTTAAPKVRAFVRAIMGGTDSVVVDVWAVRVATGGLRSEVRNVGDYRAIATAYSEAARILGVAPRDLQAITWLVASEAGLGSKRKSKIGLTCKRGTPAFLRHLLAVS
jgi:hypothetical protein